MKDEWVVKPETWVLIAAAQGTARTVKERERKIVGSAQNSGGMIASGGQPEERKWPESKHVELQGWLRTSQ